MKAFLQSISSTVTKSKHATAHHPVEALHESTPNGVRFNVQTVDQLIEPLTPYYEGEELARDVTARFYDASTEMKLEVSSLSGTKFCGHGSLVQVVMYAFDRHYPLVIRPDDIWILINYAFARHVDANAEALRSKFVSHQGQKKLDVKVDRFLMGKTPASEWERDVFPDFSRQIGECIGEETHSTLAEAFSTSTKTDRAANEITLMAAMKNYFSYGMSTLCGIPSVKLHGSEEDWLNLRRRAGQLADLMLPDFCDKWLAHLLPVLEEFVASYRGDVNHYFWQGIYKRVQHGQGSGSFSTVSGWIQLLYPFLDSGKVNEHIKPWHDMVVAQDGPEPGDLPATIVSSVPVVWYYYGREVKLHVHAGVFGFVQDAETLALSSVVSWAVTHDPEGFGKFRA